MVRKEKVFIALVLVLALVIVVADVAISADAVRPSPGTRPHSFQFNHHDMVQPQAGCRCCNFVGRIPNLRCGKVCCVDGCC
ncbi:hypothetical protein LINPERPRIM_LOCUS28401 [Linum perenne]